MHRTQCRAKHAPEAASLRTGGEWAAQAPNSGCVRPSAGARCGKAARRDLSGGAGVTRSPTATGIALMGKVAAESADHLGQRAIPRGDYEDVSTFTSNHPRGWPGPGVTWSERRIMPLPASNAGSEAPELVLMAVFNWGGLLSWCSRTAPSPHLLSVWIRRIDQHPT